MGWDRPLVVAAAEWLAARFRTRRLGGGIDLSHVLIVTPGKRVSRSVLEELVGLGERDGCWVSPGRLITPSQIGASLFPLDQPEAPPELRAAAWGAALRGLPKSRFETILRRRPAQDEAAEWMRIGAEVDNAVGELARELLRPADARAACDELQLPGDSARWDSIDLAFTNVQELLRTRGHVDRHQSLLAAMEHESSFRDSTLENIVLIGVTELDRASKVAIERASKNVWSLVFGPESEESVLDEWGCVCVARESLTLRSDQIEFAVDYRDAAVRAMGRLAAWTEDNSGLTPRELSVCAPDSAITTELQLIAENTPGVAFHDASGESIGRSETVKLFARLQAHARERTCESLAQLAKHPAVERWLEDRVHAGLKLVRTLDEAAIAAPGARAAELANLSGDCGKLIEDLLGPTAPAPLGDQLSRVREMLERLLDGQQLSPREAAALRSVGDAIGTLTPLTDLMSSLALWRAMELVLELLRTSRLPEESRRGEVEVLGWLEAAADRAPFLAVLGLNEGSIPQGRLEDSLLPEPVRRKLGMATGQTRAARDSFLLEGAVRSREKRGGVWFAVCKHDAEATPLKPSRFVFRCPDDEAMRRIQRMVHSEPEPHRFDVGLRGAPVAKHAEDAFPLTPLHEADLPDRIRTTAFREYLHSPYVFFLRHVARLTEIEEPAAEAQNNTMGTLLHAVLRQFGESDLAQSRNESKIAEFVLAEFQQQLGAIPQRRLTTVREIQIEVAKRRLATFARVQAEHAAEGWQIHAAEWKPERPIELHTPRGKLFLSGQIDRIDRRGDDWLVLDYKTADTPREPKTTHLRKKEWIDLQLPLYAMLIERAGLAHEGLQCGYILLPKNSEDGQVAYAKWSKDDLAQAHAKAAEVVLNVLDREFKHDQDPFGDGAFSRLCGVWLIEKEQDE